MPRRPCRARRRRSSRLAASVRVHLKAGIGSRPAPRRSGRRPVWPRSGSSFLEYRPRSAPSRYPGRVRERRDSRRAGRRPARAGQYRRRHGQCAAAALTPGVPLACRDQGDLRRVELVRVGRVEHRDGCDPGGARRLGFCERRRCRAWGRRRCDRGEFRYGRRLLRGYADERRSWQLRRRRWRRYRRQTRRRWRRARIVRFGQRAHLRHLQFAKIARQGPVFRLSVASRCGLGISLPVAVCAGIAAARRAGAGHRFGCGARSARCRRHGLRRCRSRARQQIGDDTRSCCRGGRWTAAVVSGRPLLRSSTLRDQFFGQFLPFDGSRRAAWRRWHAGEVRIRRRLGRRHVSGERRRNRIRIAFC